MDLGSIVHLCTGYYFLSGSSFLTRITISLVSLFYGMISTSTQSWCKISLLKKMISQSPLLSPSSLFLFILNSWKNMSIFTNLAFHPPFSLEFTSNRLCPCYATKNDFARVNKDLFLLNLEAALNTAGGSHVFKAFSLFGFQDTTFSQYFLFHLWPHFFWVFFAGSFPSFQTSKCQSAPKGSVLSVLTSFSTFTP